MATSKTVKADDRRRVLLPDIAPNERFDYSIDRHGRIILRRLRPIPETADSSLRVIKLKKVKGRWGAPVKVSREAIAQSVREERRRRQ
jgi:hypothetical protein